MSGGTRFLNSVAQALAAMSLYQDGHPARERALDAAFLALDDLQARAPRQTFTFLAGEVVHGQEPLPEMRGWEWAERLARAGVQRLEFDERVERAELEVLLDEVLARVSLTAADSPELRQMRNTRARFGAVGLRGDAAAEGAPQPEQDIVHPDAYPLIEEAEAVRWMHGEVEARRALPLAEAEAVVRSLGVAMHGERRMVLPLVRLREFDEYTTTHSLNVAVLSMALAESLGHGSGEVRAAGVAGLLHDIGKVNIPRDLLNKPGKLTPAERETMNRHPVDGARLLLEAEGRLELAAIVAYEHHLMHDGAGGYPTLRHARTCHACSRLAHVCDVYDALRTRRPYRDAWENERVLQYVEERAGTEFDPHYAGAFVRMMREWEVRTTVFDDRDLPPANGEAAGDAKVEGGSAETGRPLLDLG